MDAITVSGSMPARTSTHATASRRTCRARKSAASFPIRSTPTKRPTSWCRQLTCDRPHRPRRSGNPKLCRLRHKRILPGRQR